jgi:hypothetical protein
MTRIRQSLRDDAFIQDPYSFYHRARAAGPVPFWEDLGKWAAMVTT